MPECVSEDFISVCSVSFVKEIQMEYVTEREGKKTKALVPGKTKQNTSPEVD